MPANLIASRSLSVILLLLSLWSNASSFEKPTSSEADSQSDKRYQFQWAWSEQEVQQAGARFWPQFRGPTGDGVAASSAKAVTTWSETENIKWKTSIVGRAWSSPVVWGDQVWLTSASEDGAHRWVIVLNTDSGQIVHEEELFQGAPVQKDHHVFNSYASPTAVLDAQNAYITFGAYGTACIDRKSFAIKWKRTDLPCNHYRGPGSSPILFENLVIFHMDGFDYKYVIALDRESGATVWKTDRQVDYGTDDGDIHKAFSTPTLINVNGQVQLVSTTSKAALAYDPRNGKEFWRIRYDEFSATAKPLFDGKTIYINSGFSKATLLAVKAGGTGDITDSGILWKQDRGIGSKPSQLLHNGLIFNAKDDGIISCIAAKDGEVLWQKRVGGEFSSSPILVQDKLYFVDQGGKGYVFLADSTGTLVATNTLDEGCLSSPAMAGNDLLIRTKTHLYRIGSK